MTDMTTDMADELPEDLPTPEASAPARRKAPPAFLKHVRVYEPVAPANGNLLAAYTDMDGNDWELWSTNPITERNPTHTWLYAKVLRMDGKHKANYWVRLAWDRVGRTRDAGLLSTNHPDVYAWLESQGRELLAPDAPDATEPAGSHA